MDRAGQLGYDWLLNLEMTMKRLAFVAAMFLAACSSNSSNGSGPDAGGNGSVDGGGNTTDGGGNGAKPIIFTIVMENHDYAEIVGVTTDAPYINGLIDQYGLATNYKDTGHPSLPNYLNMISGDNQYPGIVDVGPNQTPYFPSASDNLGHQMAVAGITWRSYQEDMGTPCRLTDNGNYATKHDPFLYFDNIQNGANDLCANTSVDFSQFAADLASNDYRYMWITPNLLNDGHNPTNDPVKGLKQSDTWLSTEIPKIMDSDGYRAGGVIFLTWDEAEGRTNLDFDRIPMIIISNRIKSAGMTSDTAYTHQSYLATVEDMLGLDRLDTVASAPNTLEFLTP